jgi:hypothetical protein
MNIKEIVCCYVSKIVPMPDDFSKLRESFIRNEFSEKEITATKWTYKRGAGLALEFNYDSESNEMHVVLEHIDDQLKISVGNWGFPFEPLLMKKRFQKNLELLVSQITQNGELDYAPKESQEIVKQAKRKRNIALVFITCSIAILVLYVILTKT